MKPSPSLVVITASSKPLFAESNSAKRPITPLQYQQQPDTTSHAHPDNTVQKFSFSADGLLESTNPVTLTGTDILEAEALARTDLTGDGVIATTGTEQLTTGHTQP